MVLVVDAPTSTIGRVTSGGSSEKPPIVGEPQQAQGWRRWRPAIVFALAVLVAGLLVGIFNPEREAEPTASPIRSTTSTIERTTTTVPRTTTTPTTAKPVPSQEACEQEMAARGDAYAIVMRVLAGDEDASAVRETPEEREERMGLSLELCTAEQWIALNEAAPTGWSLDGLCRFRDPPIPAICDPSRANDEARRTAPPASYVVEGSGSAFVTYTLGGSNIQQETVSLPWRRDLSTKPSFASISAQLEGSGTITCKIINFGDIVVSQATSSGDYVIASCS